MITPLDSIGEDCIENPYVNWISTDNLESQEIAQLTAEILVKYLKEVKDSDIGQ